KPPKFIDSWETVVGDFGEHEKTDRNDLLSDQETMQQLVDLGYIERPDEKIEISILKTTCDLKHNLARVYLGKKEYTNSIYISLEEGEFDKDEIYLNELRSRDKKFKINTYFAEAKILLNKNKVNQALELLITAKNNKPNGEVWFQIGKIYLRLSRFQQAIEAF